MSTKPEETQNVLDTGQSGVKVNPNEEVSSEIDFQITKQLLKIGVWVVSGIGILILGTIGGAVYTINGKVNELDGKYSSPEKFIESTTNRIEKLEEENKTLQNKIHTLEVLKLQEEINQLKQTKN